MCANKLNMKRCAAARAVFVMLLCGAASAFENAHAAPAVETQPMMFGRDTAYDIYYEVSAYEVNRLESVIIVDIVALNGISFLRIRYSGIADREGYILWSSVRAILPTQASKPYRSADGRKQY